MFFCGDKQDENAPIEMHSGVAVDRPLYDENVTWESHIRRTQVLYSSRKHYALWTDWVCAVLGNDDYSYLDFMRTFLPPYLPISCNTSLLSPIFFVGKILHI